MLKLMLMTLASRLTTAVVNFGTIMLLSRKLGPEGKGFATLMLVIVISVQLICDFMGGAAMVYLAPRYRLRNILIPAWSWTAFWSLLAPPVVMLIRPDLYEYYGWHIAGLSFLNAAMNQQLHLLNGREKYNQVNALNLMTAMLVVSSLAWFIWYNPKPIHYVYALYAGWLPSLIISTLILWKLPKTGDSVSILKSLRSLLTYSSANQFGHLLQFSSQRIAFFLLPVYSLGIYSNAVSLAEAMWMLSTSIATIQYGTIANSNSRQEAIRLTLPLFRASILVTSAAGLILLMLPEAVFGVLFGPAFTGVKTSMVILMPGVIAISGYLILGHYFSGTGQFMKNNRAIASGLVVTLTGFLLLYLLQGNQIADTQAAMVTTCANLATFFSVIWLFKSDSGIAITELLPRLSDLKTLINRIKRKVKNS
jgi:O-antigen/teichoic acid export membrane protein